MNINILKYIFSILFVCTLFFIPSCSDDEPTNPGIISDGLSGRWQFTTTPWNHYIDTTILKGKNGSDFTVDPSINDEVYLYESDNQIIGFTGPFIFRGSKSDSIRLDVFEPIDGRYLSDTSTIKSSEMKLVLNSSGFIEGWGKITLDRDTTGVINDTYKIFGRKLGNITTDNVNNLRNYVLTSWTDKICDVAGDVMSDFVQDLTDGWFRPMDHCWGDHDGGGFYVFGHTGPGNLYPIFTQTYYYPMEWAYCSVRKYGFEFSYDGQVMAVSALIDLLRTEEQWLKNIGLMDSTFEAMINNFFNTYGNFAFLEAYNIETRAAALYVIVENGSNNAHTHELPMTIINKLDPLYSGGFYYSSGNTIYDSWHMRRSDFLVCNTPLLFCYLIGTANVQLN